MTSPEYDIAATGERVFLRRPVLEDREAFCALVSGSREFLSRWALGMPVDKDPDGSDWFQRTLQANTTGRNKKLLICRVEDEVLLGCMNLNEIVRGAFQNTFLGYWIGAPYARLGYMGEALQLVMRYAFQTLKLHRLEANIQPGNAPSIALVRRAGFRHEGNSQRYLWTGDRWSDHERWALTVEEWRPQK